jgi:hypothetical protein
VTGDPNTAARPALLTPPPLPARWVDMRPALAIGTGLWFLAFCGLLVARYGYQAATGIWLTTCLAGWLLGLVGTAVMYWQRAAGRRGSRSAQHVG